MQISPSKPAGLTVHEAAPGEVRAASAEKKRASEQGSTPVGRGLGNWNPNLNHEISAAQRALTFLDRADTMLQSLKSEISAALAGRPEATDRLDARLNAFKGLWKERQQATGASVDGQLEFTGAGKARQHFTIRELDMRTLRAGGNENLVFSVGAQGQKTLAVRMEPNLPPEAIASRLNHALAPADIRAQIGEDGALRFSTPQHAWPAVRDTLAVKGGGIRFPGGKLHAVQAVPTPDAVRPEAWSALNDASLRSALHDIVMALDRIRQVREAVNNALIEARRNIGEGIEAKGDYAAMTFARNFESLARQPRYEVHSALAPALNSVSRSRVLSLLALR